MRKNLLLILLSLSFGLMLSASDGFTVDYNRTTKGTQQLSFELQNYAIDNIVQSGVQYSFIDFASSVRTRKSGWAE